MVSREVPIIILNWNGIEDTIECLYSLESLEGVPYHVYLVDNASKKPQPEQLQKLYGQKPKVSLIFNKKNLGFTKGNNNILKNLIEDPKIKYVVLLNNDVVVTPGWLRSLLNCAEKNKAHMIASKMINYYDRSIMDNAGHYMLNTAEILPLGHSKPITDYQRAFTNIGACGGATLYSTQMLRHIGIFDEFFETGYEDAELGLRANLMGYQSFFCPEAVIFHKGSRSIDKIRNAEYMIRIQRNIFYTYFKLMPKTFLAKNLPWAVFKYFSIVLVNVLIMRFAVVRLHFKTLKMLFGSDIPKALLKRKNFYANKNEISLHPFTRDSIKFFLKTDLRRFWKFYVLRETNLSG